METKKKSRSLRDGYFQFFRAVRAQSVEKIEYAFYRLGMLIARRPLVTCLLSLLLCAASGSGLLRWRAGLSDLELYMPVDSPVRSAAHYVDQHFREDSRYESVIVQADNVLEPEVLGVIAELEEEIKTTRVNGSGWEDICARYSTWFQGPEADAGESVPELPPEFTAALQQAGLLQNDCVYQSPLRLWPKGLPRNITRADVQRVVNKSVRSSSNVLTDLESMLGGIQMDEKGNIVSAKAVILNWLLKQSEPIAREWEKEFLNKVLSTNRTLPQGVSIYAVATRSYNDMLDQVLESNMTVLFAGFSLIILYVIIMLGRINLIQQRIYLSLVGVSIVGLTIFASYGFCFHLGFFFGPVHPILPFLLLGIGVDDMFIIVDCLDHVKKKHSNLSMPEKIGKAVQNAGVSITVTSFTDIVAFAIGISTKMPFLQSFCMFAAMGITFLFIFEITFFVGCLTLDEYRVTSKREGCCFVRLKDWEPNTLSQRNIAHDIFAKYVGPTLVKVPVKIFIIMLTIFLVAFNTWCILQVEQKFDPIWYLDSSSYPIKFNNKLNEFFPKYGKRAGIYLTDFNYYADGQTLNKLSQELRENVYINQATIKVWFQDFEAWMNKKRFKAESEDDYKGYLSEFLLFSKGGQEHLKDLKFNTFPFGDYNITTTRIPIQFIMMNTTSQQLDAISSLSGLLESMNLTRGQYALSYSPEYIPWYTNKIIGEELLRNLGLSVVAVAIVTLLLIQELQVTFWVLSCVIFTLIDLVGSMYLYGLTIEISTSIMVLLCTGLTVDYAAHIGYEFNRMSGNGNERAVASLAHMGPAVFNGGFSTFLAFVLLGFSNAYIFRTFFKLFTSVVVFGCFHGLLFLPVILSWLGPTSQSDTEHHANNKDHTGTAKASYIPNGYYIPSVEGIELSIEDDTRQRPAQQQLLPNDRDSMMSNHIDENQESRELQSDVSHSGKW